MKNSAPPTEADRAKEAEDIAKLTADERATYDRQRAAGESHVRAIRFVNRVRSIRGIF